MAKKRKLERKSEPTPDPVEQEEPYEEPATDLYEDDPVSPADEPTEDPVEEDPASEDDEKPQIPEETEDPASDAEEEEEDDDEEEEEEEEDGSDPSSVQKLLDPLPKDQLAELLRDAAVKHPDVLAQVLQVADADPAHRKIFVHGLGWDTTTEVLTAAFRTYGEIEDCKAVTDKATGKSKGYGFVLFKHRSGAQRALKEPQKKIGNRMTACQLASAGSVPPPAPPASEYTQRKIYVSNVGVDLDPQKVLQFFSKYGEIEEGPLGLDKVTGKLKGFCLFVYKSIESAKKALEEPHKNFEGHVLHCQKAIDGPKATKHGFQFQQGGAQHHGGAHGSQFPRSDNAGIMAGMGSHVPAVATPGHAMPPSAAGMGYNQAAQPSAAAAAAAAGLNPALGQALTALLAAQGSGLTNLLGALGSAGLGGPAVNQAGPAPMANNNVHGVNPGAMGGYGAPSGYGNQPMGQGGAGRNQGHMGGMPPYMGR